MGWKRVDIDWSKTRLPSPPFDKQKPFVEDCVQKNYQFVASFCGLQAGKSRGGAYGSFLSLYGPSPMVLPEHLLGRTSMDFWIVSKDYRLADVAFETFRDVVPPETFLSEKECRARGLKRFDPHTHWLRERGKADPKPIRLRVRTASDPEAMRASPNLGLVWADEAAYWKDATWKNAMGRAIVAGTRYIITTTPKGKNWLYRDIAVPGGWGGKRKTDKTISVRSWRSVDNPYADKEYLDRLRKKFGPDYASQELDGLFTSNVGYVYDFDRSEHTTPNLPSTDPLMYRSRVVGVDPGYGDPYAAALLLKHWDGQWYVADEMYLPSKAVAEDALPKLRYWHKHWKVEKFYVDKRRPTDWEMLRRAGLPAVPNIDVFGEDDRRTVMPMIRIVQRIMRENNLRVLSHCEWTCEEFEGYAFRDNEERNRGENPVDYKNHLMDAVRYGIASVEARPEDLRPRYRQGYNVTPRASGKRKVDPRDPKANFVTAKEMLAYQEKKWSESLVAGKGRRDRSKRRPRLR